MKKESTIDSAPVAAVILAAGKGTRMKSDRAKVLHEILGKPMILHVLETAVAVFGRNIVVVVGHQADHVKQVVKEFFEVRFACQTEQKGTGHAVLCTESVIPAGCEEIVILCGDVPLVRADTLSQFVQTHRREKRELSVLGTRLSDPTGYGRLLIDGAGRFTGIVEEADATRRQKALNIVNTGIYCVNRRFLFHALALVKDDNAQGEIYLTDIVGIGYRENRRMGISVVEDPHEFTGINRVEELLAVETFLQKDRME